MRGIVLVREVDINLWFVFVVCSLLDEGLNLHQLRLSMLDVLDRLPNLFFLLRNLFKRLSLSTLVLLQTENINAIIGIILFYFELKFLNGRTFKVQPLLWIPTTRFIIRDQTSLRILIQFISDFIGSIGQWLVRHFNGGDDRQCLLTVSLRK